MGRGNRGQRHARAIALLLIASVAALLSSSAGALAWQAASPDEALAARFAPIIILQRQAAACDSDGEPFLPAPVNVVFADPAVVLREGPEQHPAKSPIDNPDLYALPDEFATDFPGKPRTPGCDYETHFKAVMGDQRPVIYAHIATEEGRRGIALQYWFFYYFNEFNNLHEGDWEMIQLLFDADSVEEALTQEPVQVAFAQHNGGETADWDAPKLEREGTRPVVYASRGSHASYYGPGLWLGWGQDGSGLGCDVTSGDPVRIDPEVRLVPATIAGPDDPFAWVTFSGRWGERETWVYDGPSGPAFKPRWTAPISWMDDLRADSIRVSAATILGPDPSDVFCSVIENGSLLLTLSKPYPLLVAGFVAGGLALAAAIIRLSWRNLRATWRHFRTHLALFAGIGAITIPATLAVSLIQYLLSWSPEFAALTGISEDSATLQAAVSVISLFQRVLLLVVVTPAVIQATGDIAAGRPSGIGRSLREGLRRLPDYLWTIARSGIIVLLLTISIIGLPWAVNRSVRWLLGGQAAVLDGLRGELALTRSAAAVQGRWWQTAANGVTLAFLGAAPGIVVALALMILARVPIDAANSAASLVYAIAQPFAIVGLTMLYLRSRGVEKS